WCFIQLCRFSILEIMRNDKAGREHIAEEDRRADILKKFGENGYIRIMARAANLLNHIVNICFNSIDVARSPDSLPLKILIIVISSIGALLELTLIGLVILFIKPKEKKTVISVILGFALVLTAAMVGSVFKFDSHEDESDYGGVVKVLASMGTLATPCAELVLGAQNLDRNSIALVQFYIAALFGFGFQLAQSISIHDWMFVVRHSRAELLVFAVLIVFLLKFIRQRTADAIVEWCKGFGELFRIKIFNRSAAESERIRILLLRH
ncbi:hypothetical protein LINGRAHAP2_LOCUS6346, partial [Linum grandiflorum]